MSSQTMVVTLVLLLRACCISAYPVHLESSSAQGKDDQCGSVFVPDKQVSAIPVQHFMAGSKCWLRPSGLYLVFHGGFAAADVHSSTTSLCLSLGRRTIWLGRVFPRIVRTST